MRIFAAFIGVFWFVVASAHAQNVEGQVTASDGAPIAGLPLKVTDPKTGRSIIVFTDQSGGWQLNGLGAGTYTVEPFLGSQDAKPAAKGTFVIKDKSIIDQWFVHSKPTDSKLQVPDSYKALGCASGC